MHGLSGMLDTVLHGCLYTTPTWAGLVGSSGRCKWYAGCKHLMVSMWLLNTCCRGRSKRVNVNHVGTSIRSLVCVAPVLFVWWFMWCRARTTLVAMVVIHIHDCLLPRIIQPCTGVCPFVSTNKLLQNTCPLSIALIARATYLDCQCEQPAAVPLLLSHSPASDTSSAPVLAACQQTPASSLVAG
jgi:hypothetical protein